MFKSSFLVLGLFPAVISTVVAQNFTVTVTSTETTTATATETYTKTVNDAGPAVTLYPQQITDTTSHYEVYRFFVNAANNDAYNMKNVQLIPNGQTSRVGIDNKSPVLQWQLENGTLSSWAGISEGPYKLGPVAGLANVSSINPIDLGLTTRQQFVFRNADDDASNGFNNTMNQWYLQLISDEGTYGLYNYAFPNGEWHICKKGGNYQIFFYEPSYFYPGPEQDAPGCSFATILTTLGPVDGCSGGLNGGGPCLRYAGMPCTVDAPCTPQQFESQF